MLTACGAHLIASQFFWTEEAGSLAAPPRVQLNATATSEREQNRSSSVRETAPPPAGIAAISFYVQERKYPVGIGALAQVLVPGGSPAQVKRFIDLNSHFRYAQYGTVVLVASNYDTDQYTDESRHFLEIAPRIEALRKEIGSDRMAVLLQNWDLFFLAIAEDGDDVIGAGALVMANHAASLKKSLNALEQAAQTALKRTGSLQDPVFWAQREQIIKGIDTRLNRMLMAQAGIPREIRVSSALGLSSKSATHIWRSGGSVNYVKQYATITNWFSKVDSTGTKLGLAYSLGLATLEVYRACTAENANTEQCLLASSSIAVGTTAGIVTGGAVGIIGGKLCIALGLAGGWPGVACALTVAYGATSVGDYSSEVGRDLTLTTGQILIELLKD